MLFHWKKMLFCRNEIIYYGNEILFCVNEILLLYNMMYFKTTIRRKNGTRELARKSFLRKHIVGISFFKIGLHNHIYNKYLFHQLKSFKHEHLLIGAYIFPVNIDCMISRIYRIFSLKIWKFICPYFRKSLKCGNV